jgi:hypothetical protein
MVPELRARHPLAPAAVLRLAAALGLVAILAGSCGGPAGRGDAAQGTRGAPAFPAETLAVSVGLDSGSYAIGEPMVMRLCAVNRSVGALVLEFPTSQRFDFVVEAGGKPVWQWSADKMFAQVLGRETVAPGDSLVYEARWDQVLADGTNPGLGAYTIRGILKTRPEVASQGRRFGVVD